MAEECSPGRKPGDLDPIKSLALEEGDRIPGVGGQSLPPLRGFENNYASFPGLTPGATFFRHLRWLAEWLATRGTRPPLLLRTIQTKH